MITNIFIEDEGGGGVYLATPDLTILPRMGENILVEGITCRVQMITHSLCESPGVDMHDINILVYRI